MIWVRRILETLVVVAFAALIVNNISLHRQVKGMQQALAFARRSHAGKLFESGEPFEGIGLIAPNGHEIISDESLPAGREVILIVNPSCGTCEEAASDAARIRQSAKVPLIVVSNGNAADTSAFANRHGIAGITFRATDTTAPTLRRKLSSSPQVLLADGRRILRTCTSVAECFDAGARATAKQARK